MNPRELAKASYEKAIKNQTLRDKPEHWHLWKRAYDEAFRDFKDQLPTREEIEIQATEYAEKLNSCYTNDLHGFQDGMETLVKQIKDGQSRT